jgi:hypothetical protein
MKTALILTGQIRTFNNTIKKLYDNIIEPNNVVAFIATEVETPEELINVIRSNIPNVEIGGIIAVPTFRTPEFASIMNMIESSNRPGLSHAVFERSMKADGIPWSIDYVRDSGTVIQYYQFWKIWKHVLNYERHNNVVFTHCIRSRPDIYINEKIELSNDDFLGNPNIKAKYNDNKLELRSPNGYFLPLNKELNSKFHILWTLGNEQVWIGNRSTFDILSNLVFEFGSWDSGHPFSFNSETQFHQFCKHHNIQHKAVIEKEWPMNFCSEESLEPWIFGIYR